MKQGLKRVRMYHPWKKDSEGNAAIQEINKRTVDTGMAAKLGYLPVPIAEAPPAPDYTIKVTKPAKAKP